jgi:hypothetical protein
MSIAGKRDDFTRSDLVKVGQHINLAHIQSTIDEVLEAVSGWNTFAKQAGVVHTTANMIGNAHRKLET